MKDLLGATCSGLCMIHCASVPILAASGTSFIGLAYLFSESTHLWLSMAMLSIALWAFPSGWRIHKHLLPGLLAFVGSILMAIAFIVPEHFEIYWTITSGISFIAGHLVNRYLLIMRNSQ